MTAPVVLTYFVRHGATVLNQKNFFRGMADPELAAEGRREAYRLATYFESIDLSAIFYSDKNRSEETAHIIDQKHPDVECFGTKNLWPWDVGKFSGQPKSKENLEELEHYVQNPDAPIPQGESLNEFKARVRPCIKEALQIADKMGAPTLCVVHSSVIHEVGSYIESSHGACLVEPGGVVAICYDGDTGQLRARPIFKGIEAGSRRADTVS